MMWPIEAKLTESLKVYERVSTLQYSDNDGPKHISVTQSTWRCVVPTVDSTETHKAVSGIMSFNNYTISKNVSSQRLIIWLPKRGILFFFWISSLCYTLLDLAASSSVTQLRELICGKTLRLISTMTEELTVSYSLVSSLSHRRTYVRLRLSFHSVSPKILRSATI